MIIVLQLLIIPVFSFLPLSDYKSPDFYVSRYSRYIWTYYDREDANGVQEFNSLNRKQLNNEWDFVFLTEHNLSTVLDVGAFPSGYFSSSPQLQSDYIRLSLVERYGGFWMDLSTIIGNKTYLEYVRNEMIRTHSEFFGECLHECPLGWIESGFFYAPRESVFIHKWRKEMDIMFHMGAQQYMHHMDLEGVRLPKLVCSQYPKLKQYFIIFVTQQVALQRKIPRNTPLLIIRAITNMFNLIHDCHWNRDEAKPQIMQEIKAPRYNITKLTGPYRRLVFNDTVKMKSRSRQPGVWKYPRVTLLTYPSVNSWWRTYFIVTFFYTSFLILHYSRSRTDLKR